jgi:hypothetical protein
MKENQHMKLTTEELETVIDSDGAWSVLLTLELVLGEKAEHLRHNWQDRQTAKLYDRFSRKCGALARELAQANV